jgi:hypothetical protein
MSEEKTVQKPMSIEQAGNFIKEKRETVAEDMKKEAKEAPISFASPEDRKSYLIYGISLMTDVSEQTKNDFCSITGRAASLYTTKEVSLLLRKFLVLRINGYSLESLQHHLKTNKIILGKVEVLALRTIKGIIDRKRNSELPIIGG